MTVFKQTSRIPIFPLFIAASLLVGWFIPEFYAWTDSDQSRPSPLLWKVPLGSAIASSVFCIALPWLLITSKPSSDTPRTPMRFSVRTMLLVTAGVAMTIPLFTKFPLVFSGIICAAAFIYFIAFCVRNPPHRMAGAALVACLVLPYSWVVGYDELDRLLPELVVFFAGMPAIFPAAMISQLFGQHSLESQWLMYLLTALELVVGIWVICLGPKRSIAYLILVMHLSAVGSLGFYMMCIA